MRMKTSDEALAKAAASGDRDAFAVLLERRYDGLFRLSFRLTGSRAEAEDLTQEICAVLPGKLRAFRGEAKFSTWLYRVAVNAAHDRRRKAHTHARMAQSWGEWEIAIKAEQAETSGQILWLNEAMTTLPDDLRKTIALVLDQELTHREAGDVLGVSEGTISWRVSQAKKHLQNLAEQEARQ